MRAQKPVEADANERRFRVSFAELQRMRLRKLQVLLVKDAVDMRYGLAEASEWEEHLRDYSKISGS